MYLKKELQSKSFEECYINQNHNIMTKHSSIAWSKTLNKLQQLLKKNDYDIAENNYYNLAVIEEIEEGVYPIPKNEYWYSYNKSNNFWKIIEKPKYYEKITAFSL